MSPMHATLLVGLLVLATGCGTARRDEPLSRQRFSQDPAIVKGEHVFYENCHQCHVNGEAALAPSLNNKPLPGFMIHMQVRHGLGAMPAFSKSQISDEELNDLIAYLKTLRKRG